MMYHHQLTEAFDVTELAAFLAERVSTITRVVVVSEVAEQVAPELQKAWKVQQSQLLTERDHEPDIAYMAVLTDIITAMQQTDIAYGEAHSSSEIVVVHPYQLQGQVWEDRHIVVCTDETSLQKCLQLLPIASADFRLFVQCTHNTAITEAAKQKLRFEPLRKAEKQLRDLLREQDKRCDKLGIDLDSVVVGDVIDVELLGEVLHANKSSQYDSFVQTQKQLARLRIVAGRAKAHRSFSDSRLQNLKRITAHLTKDLGNSDWQLFDDPLQKSWAGKVTVR